VKRVAFPPQNNKLDVYEEDSVPHEPRKDHIFNLPFPSEAKKGARVRTNQMHTFECGFWKHDALEEVEIERKISKGDD
jgi:hypothetical protein